MKINNLYKFKQMKLFVEQSMNQCNYLYSMKN